MTDYAINPPPPIVPDKCIFYLDGTKERTGLWKRTGIYDIKVVDKKYTNITWGNGVLNFTARKTILNPNGAYSASLFAKRNEIGGSRYEEFGFLFSNYVSNDCGYMNSNYIFIDDNSTSAASNSVDVSSIIAGKELDPFFITVCKDIDGTSYVTLNGKLIYTTTNLRSAVSFFDNINIFDADRGGALKGWIDKVVIHKDICLYKEDFTVLPMDQYPKYKYITDNDSLKLY